MEAGLGLDSLAPSGEGPPLIGDVFFESIDDCNVLC